MRQGERIRAAAARQSAFRFMGGGAMRRLDRWIAGGLVAAALGLAALYGARVAAFRTLEPFRGPVAGYEAFAAFRGEMERCDVRSGQFVVRGWIARPGVSRARHATRVVLRDSADGRLFVLRTDLTVRPDVNTRLAAELRDGIDYRTSGFAAWVDLARSTPAIEQARVFIAYDEGGARAGERYVLVATECTVP